MCSPATSNFAMSRTRDEISDLLRFGHIIPVGKGYTRQYVEEQYSGWTWNELLEVWRAADVLAPADSMQRCKDGVVAVHFNSADDFLVEWADGSETRSVDKPDRGCE